LNLYPKTSDEAQLSMMLQDLRSAGLNEAELTAVAGKTTAKLLKL
jgi:hypothetical protein